MKWLISRRLTDDRVLNQIVVGMLVRDEQNLDMGKVKRVFLGAVDDQSLDQLWPVTHPRYTTGNEVSFLKLLDGAVAVRKIGKSSSELCDRMRQHGFILVDTTGLMSQNYFALPDQIESVLGGIVFLRVRKDELDYR